MSNIFDALQRSEVERSGAKLSALPAATELLERAERQATSKWESGAEPPDAGQHSVSEVPDKRSSTVSIKETPVAAPPSPVGDRLDISGQFQSLETSLSPRSRLVCITEREDPAAEAFRLLGVRLRHLRRDRPLKKLLITSTIPQEGKSTIAANLACALALGSHPKVLLLEGDVRRPSLSQVFGLAKVPGLCECLQGGRPLAASVYRLEKPSLWILPAGSVSGNPLELLQSGKLSAVMDRLAAWFDWIVIDSPPVLPVADTSVWTRLADGILVVARRGITERRQLQRGLEALDSTKLIGAILNSSEASTYSDYYYRPATASQSADNPEK